MKRRYIASSPAIPQGRVEVVAEEARPLNRLTVDSAVRYGIPLDDVAKGYRAVLVFPDLAHRDVSTGALPLPRYIDGEDTCGHAIRRAANPIKRARQVGRGQGLVYVEVNFGDWAHKPRAVRQSASCGAPCGVAVHHNGLAGG